MLNKDLLKYGLKFEENELNDDIDWSNISVYQNLSESFIRKFKLKVLEEIEI